MNDKEFSKAYYRIGWRVAADAGFAVAEPTSTGGDVSDESVLTAADDVVDDYLVHLLDRPPAGIATPGLTPHARGNGEMHDLPVPKSGTTTIPIREPVRVMAPPRVEAFRETSDALEEIDDGSELSERRYGWHRVLQRLPPNGLAFALELLVVVLVLAMVSVSQAIHLSQLLATSDGGSTAAPSGSYPSLPPSFGRDGCRDTVQPGDGAPSPASRALWSLYLGPNGYGTSIAGCVDIAKPLPGTDGWYQEGFRGGQLQSVSTWSPSFGAAIALGQPAMQADLRLNNGSWVAISNRYNKNTGDAQVLWTANGSYLFARYEESRSYIMLPPGATQAWDEESRRLGVWLWPLQGTPTNDSPLVFDLVQNSLDAIPSAVIQCVTSTCSTYLVGANSKIHQAGNRIVDLSGLVKLP